MSDPGDTSQNDYNDDALRDSLSENYRREQQERKKAARAHRREEGEESNSRGLAGNSARILLYGGAAAVAIISFSVANIGSNGTPDKSPVDHLRDDDGCWVDRDGNIIDEPTKVGLSAAECKQLENRKKVDSLPAPRNSWSDPSRASDPIGLTRGLELSL